jgi:hypothetical protein
MVSPLIGTGYVDRAETEGAIDGTTRWTCGMDYFILYSGVVTV